MRTIWQSLAWKEWHEHKWKLAAVTVILLVVTSAVFWQNDSEVFVLSLGVMIYGVIPIAVFLGASDAAGESTRGTLRFTQSLPVSMRYVAIWKFAIGLGTCVVPILLTIGGIVAWYLLRGRFDSEIVRDLEHTLEKLYHPVEAGHKILIWGLGATTLATTVAASLYAWTLTLGVNRRTEVRAGATALAAIITLWLGFIAAGHVFAALSMETLDRLGAVCASVLPGGIPVSLVVSLTGPNSNHANAYLALAVAAVFYPLLLASFVWRFGASEACEACSRSMAVSSAHHPQWLPQPFQSPFRAILWKQRRESGPIAAVGMTAILFFLCFNVAVNRDYYLGGHAYLIAELHAGLTMQIGFLVVLIVGIGVFDRDLDLPLHTFWRSRPIDPNLWFWAKYLTGLVVLVLALGIPILISGTWYFLSTGWWQQFPTRHASHIPLLAMIISILIAVYALALTAICLVRVAIYAAILCVGVLAGGMSVAWYFLGDGSAQQTMNDWATNIAVMMSIVAVLSTLVGWWAVRQDIGWKNR